ncbi:T9SS type A sorting domain-containing protein [uncultured Winogradskyella sp.]|uniref:T9SS type A sorting domain-containing protein n=1 Tax=uncultured Winogradskyella sp. TaxID=395353 RepID=UPI00260DD6C6|nr:T9SS type A sorting domain-containing protein [uncultured Winogradskyella sp.]
MKTILLFLSFLITTVMVAQIGANQIDDFQDGTTQNWRIGNAANAAQSPMNIADAGPNGEGDNCLQYTSTGSGNVASKMIFFSQGQQWSGNFTSETIGSIDMDVRVQTNDLNLRLAMQGSNGTRICSTNPVALNANGIWTSISIPVDPASFTLISGTGDVASVLANVTTLRILSSSAPTWQNADIIASTIQVDNVTANSTLSTSELSVSDNDFVISPNPATNRINLTLNSFNASLNLEVYDVLGKRIYKESINRLETSINVSNWKSGVYLVRVSNNETIQTKRFIKQ